VLRRRFSRRSGALTATALAAAMILAATTGTSLAATTAAPPVQPALTGAARSADSLVAGRPAVLHAGPDDAFVQKPVISAQGWQYVPYDRTYRGLPVLGGDFVVVVNPSGQVASTSVAQPATIHDLSTTPKLTASAAAAIAAKQLATTTGVTGARLVVDATSTAPRLAWESTVLGTGADGPSQLTVDVDAVTGTVLHTKDNVVHDIGHAALNASQVNVADALINCPSGNCPNQHTWILAYPSGGGQSCDAPSVHRTDPEPLVWGDGDPTHAETACVDAMFDVDTENAMLSSWLGRSGLDGAGAHDGFPMFTSSELVNNSYYVSQSPINQPEVHLGHSPNGVWWASLDIVGHENGHGVDDHTPGGISGGGTREFIADAFGTATEWFANEQAPWDTADYVVGDNTVVNVPTGGRRIMFHPSLNGSSQDCYDSTTAAGDPYIGAGVGDHWFYLLAEGTSPFDGQPFSPTCNGSTVAGIGIQNTMKILYNAMLMKNSSSSYLTYRSWTLTAAKNLFPGNCDVVARVKQAWDAVGVPTQPGEITACVPSLIGWNHNTAIGIIGSAGLSLASVNSAPSQSPAGTVIAQSPPAGTLVAAGSGVSFTVSSGGVSVPDLRDDNQSQATSALSAVGLGISVGHQMACVNPGDVMSQNPSAGTVVAPGSIVHVTIDSGTPRTCIIK
jgi:Zn-dependent metalloprotease